MIEVKGLCKKYANKIAINDVSFSVREGEILGFLGPNGAGKSTTMNIITGCLAATEGQVIIDGHDIFEEPIEAKKLIGYLPEIPPLYMDMTPYEYLDFVAEAKGIASEEADRQICDIMEQTGISSVSGRLIKNLSKGYRQRVGIAQAMLGNPEIIILDEPTVGLDPKQIIEIRNLIRELAENHTVILSSHILSEIQAICDRVIIISNGKLAANDTVSELVRKYSGSSNIISLTAKGGIDEVTEIIDGINGISEYTLTEREDTVDAQIIAVEDSDPREDIFSAFADKGVKLLKLTNDALSFEEIYLKLTDDASADESEITSDETDGDSGEITEEDTQIFEEDTDGGEDE